MDGELIYKEECHKVGGIGMKIHKKLGSGVKEVVYKDAMEIEFKKAAIPFEREKKFNISYGGIILPHQFIADYFVFNCMIVEVKATALIHADSFKQTLNYLKVAQIKLGIFINFGTDSLNFQRIICTH